MTAPITQDLREYLDAHRAHDGSFTVLGDTTVAELLELASAIDLRHDLRMEQCRRDTKRAYSRYLRGITNEYDHDHKRKSWTAQQQMQLELDVLRFELKKEDQ